MSLGPSTDPDEKIRFIIKLGHGPGKICRHLVIS